MTSPRGTASWSSISRASGASAIIAVTRGALKLLLSKATGAAWREYAEYDIATKTLTPLLGQNEKTEYQAAYASRAW